MLAMTAVFSASTIATGLWGRVAEGVRQNSIGRD